MSELSDALAEVKSIRELGAKLRKENADTRTALETAKTTLEARVKALEEIIANGNPDAETIAALKTEIAGLREDMTAFDADIPDAPTNG